MQIIVHPMLDAQEAILDLPRHERREAILKMLAPFGPALKPVMPPGADPVAMFGFLRPDGPEEAYREALGRLEEAGAEQTCREALARSHEAIVAEGYEPPIAAVQFGLFLLDTDTAMMKLNQGYTGFGGIPGYILVSLWPDSRNLAKLGGCVAHEFNHQIRNTVEPWRMDISVAEYTVMEGLAESSAMEIYGPGAVGPWVAEVKSEAVEEARRAIGKAKDIRGFNEVRPYIFGDEIVAAFGGKPMGVPTYAGYAAGFHLVQAYLHKTGKTAAQATLVPAAEIVEKAGYF